LNNDKEIIKTLESCIGTKFSSRWGTLLSDLTLKAVRTIVRGGNLNKLNLEIKRYAKIEKVNLKF
jgi:T-complex protein 1 subunit gamma